MKTIFHPVRKGFTLLELSIGIMLSMAIAAMTLVLFNNQLTFLKIINAQNFLTDEAPIINMHVSKLVGKADRFTLHANRDDAVAGTASRLTASPVLVMYFRQPNGVAPRRSILAFENLGAGNVLNYYVVAGDGTIGAPQWYITKRPQNVQFTAVDDAGVANGLLRMQLTGPNNEFITYSGSM